MVSAREAAELQHGLQNLEYTHAGIEKQRKEYAERYHRIQGALAAKPRSGEGPRFLESLGKRRRVGKQEQKSSQALRPRPSKNRPSKSKTTGLRPNPIRATESRTLSPPASSESSSSRQQVICNCVHAFTDPDEVFVVCESCLNLQHPACAVPDDAIGETPASPRCNNCKKIEIHRHMTLQRQKIQNMGRMVSRIVNGAEHFYGKVLWKHYCNLPKGRSSDAVNAITQMVYRQGAMVPVHPAPQSWVDEIKSCLTKMMADAGEDVVNTIVGSHCLEAFSSLSDLVQWRELAMWLLHHGFSKGRRSELGILAELLGFVEKGTYWDGGWMGDFF